MRALPTGSRPTEFWPLHFDGATTCPITSWLLLAVMGNRALIWRCAIGSCAENVNNSFVTLCCPFLCPPSKKRGYIALLMSVCRSVGPSTRWLSDDNSRTLGPRIMKLHRYIDHDSQMTTIDFEVKGQGHGDPK
ncbi:hypothetical protein DPMN_179324 [Dreissena polymorpha]|uniref:Uncharacterized protein n=1 Tax=Dreissena polymorpha TaxID=45954 RepID=A0A9D4IJH0_DREPO|nr:hypothetical protein DPMN_179324 [Dreissena polymorpha]